MFTYPSNLVRHHFTVSSSSDTARAPVPPRRRLAGGATDFTADNLPAWD
jgi:hypothetical protein